jgi:hypothetical protein
MEMNQDRHDLTDTQAPISVSLNATSRKQLFVPDGHKSLTEVVDITKQFE